MSAQSVPPTMTPEEMKAAVASKMRVLKNPQAVANAIQQHKFQVLGEIITWRLCGVSITIPELRMLCEAHNLPLHRVPKKIQTRSQVVRTLAELEENGFIRKINDDAVKAVYVLVAEQVDRTTDTATYNVEIKFEHSKKQETLTASDPNLQDTIDALMAKYKDKCLTRDVRAMITDMVSDAHAIRLRPEGGMYLIPRDNLDFAQNLDDLIKNLSLESYLTRFAIPDTVEHQTNARRSFVEDFKREYESFMLEISKLADNEHTRDSTVSKKIDILIDLQKKANMYNDMVGLDMSVINGMTSKIQAKIAELMT